MRRTTPNELDYFFFNEIKKYKYKNMKGLPCPKCGEIMDIPFELEMEDYKKIFKGHSRQSIWNHLVRLEKHGWLKRRSLKRSTIKINPMMSLNTKRHLMKLRRKLR